MKEPSYYHSLLPLGAFVLALAPAISFAQGEPDGVVFEPVPDGGSMFTVEPKGFDLDLKGVDGTVTERSVHVPVSEHWRHGCFAVTPWLPAPEKSELSVYPDVRLNWLGMISLLTNEDVGLSDFVIESRPFGQEKTKSSFFWMDTGMMELTPLFFPDDRSCVYLGDLETSIDSKFPVVFRTEIEGESEFRGMLCGLTADAELDLFGLAFRLLPIEQ